MVWYIHCTLSSLFILSHFTVDELCKILYFFQFGPPTFLGDLVLFKKQLISNSYERVRLEEGDQNEKYSKHEWRAISFGKKCILVLQLKQSRKLYNFGPSTFSQFYFGTKFYFYFYFLVLGWARRERERSLNSNGGERNMSLTPI